jgi:vancomycin resistance protein YoaR
MPNDNYFQRYGPIQRRRNGELPPGLPEDPPPPRRPPRPVRTSQRGRGRWIMLPLLVLLLIAAAPFALTLAYAAQPLPGVTVQGAAAEGLSRPELLAVLQARYGTLQRDGITLTYADRQWRPTLNDLGVVLDLEQLTDQVLSYGKRGDPLTRAGELWQLAAAGGVDLAPQLIVDQGRLQAYLAGLAPSVEQAPVDAALSLADARVVAQAGLPGTQLLVDETANDILLAVQQLAPQTVPLRTRSLAAPIDDGELLAAQETALLLLQSPLELRAPGEEPVVWPPARLAELLNVVQRDGMLQLEVDTLQLERAIEGLAQQIDSGTAEPRLRLTDGVLQVTAAGTPGRRLQQTEALSAVSAAIMAPALLTRTVDLPVETLLPRVTAETLDELGIVELVGEGSSSFAGSADYRVTNITAGALRMDGVLIAPDEEFSFNRQLGDVSAESGFVEGYAIIGNRTQLEWGGGVCQDSTTVFRAAFWAGLPITERHAHSFYISWYDRFGLGALGDGQGMDAAIFTGVQDLKFVNDTGNWLLMQVTIDTEAEVLTVQLFGTRPDRTVTIEGPFLSNELPPPSEPIYIDDPELPLGTVRRSDTARGGRDVLIYRTVSAADGAERRDQYISRFKPWPDIFVRGTRQP